MAPDGDEALTRADHPPTPALSAGLRTSLLHEARRSIATALADEANSEPDAAEFPEPLRAVRASFVTLKHGDRLRGCIGTLEPRLPLIVEVWRNARQAAFQDPRFEPVTADELDALHLHIEVLGPLEPMPADSDEALLCALRPGEDGLVIECPEHRATFLPAVWASLPEPVDFVYELKRKAGLPGSYPAAELTISRYRTESFEESR
jgi:AmmeMemoRadiSam system protein A